MGLAVPLSGSLGAIGTSVVHGARVALERRSDGAPDLELRVEDTGGDPDRAAAVASEFVADGVALLAGPISSDVALSVRDVAEREGVPFLPTVGGNPALTEPGTRYTFRFASSNRQSGLGTVRFFESMDADRIAIVGADFSYPHAVADAITDFGPDHGLSVEAVRFVPLDVTDFDDALSGLDRSLDGLFLPFPGDGAVSLVRQLRAAGLADDAVVVGDYSFGSDPYSRRLGDDVVGLYNWGVDTDTERAHALADDLAARFDESAGVYHYLGYDLVGLAAVAVRSAGEPSPAALRDALRGVEYAAVSGWDVGFDGNGVNERYRMLVNRWVRRDGGRRNEVAFRSGPLDPDG